MLFAGAPPLRCCLCLLRYGTHQLKPYPALFTFTASSYVFCRTSSSHFNHVVVCAYALSTHTVFLDPLSFSFEKVRQNGYILYPPAAHVPGILPVYFCRWSIFLFPRRRSKTQPTPWVCSPTLRSTRTTLLLETTSRRAPSNFQNPHTSRFFLCLCLPCNVFADLLVTQERLDV
jgi:hypothetical protein